VWIELAGALLVGTGLTIACMTLLIGGASRRSVGLLSLRSPPASARRLDAARQLQRLADITGDHLRRIEIVADLHARATAAVAAADGTARGLLAGSRDTLLPADTSAQRPDRAHPQARPQASERIAA
jgi:hypothetical protein